MLNRLKSAPPLLFVLGFALFWGLPNLLYPFGHDQGEDAYVGFMMSQGAIIYEDVYHVKPPGIPLIHILSQSWFVMPDGLDMMSIRLLDLFWQALTAFFIYQIGRRLFASPQKAIFPAVLFVLMYYARDFWDTTNSDGFLNLPVTAAFLLVLIGERRNLPILPWFVGLLMGVAFLIKYPIGILLAVIGTIYLMGWRENRWIWIIVRYVWLAIGFFIPVGFFYLYLDFYDTLDSFFDFQFNYFTQYNANFASGGAQFGYAIQQFLTWARTDWLPQGIFVGVMALCLLFVRRSRQGQDRFRLVELLPLLWLIGSLAHVIFQNKYYHYHTHPILPPLALVAGQLLAYLFENRPLKMSQFASVSVACGLIVLVVINQPNRWSLLGITSFSDEIVQDIYLKSEYFPKAGYTSAGLVKTSSAVEIRSDYDDYILVWAFEPGIYYLSGRETSTRFVYNFPLMGQLVRPQLLNSFYVDLDNKPPSMIIVGVDDAIPHVSGTEEDSLEALQNLTHLRDLLDSGYMLVGQIDHYLIYDQIDG
ncbi:MAG: glycosyltransferase family 39 protein [Chloroflexota bacterium]